MKSHKRCGIIHSFNQDATHNCNVFAICSVWIFDKLNNGVDFLLRKLDKDYAMEKEEIERG